MSSLPVPVSPWTSTVQSVAATISAWLSTSRSLRLSAIIFCSPCPREARLAENRSDAFILTSVFILPRFRRIKFSELSVVGSLFLPEIYRRTERAEQRLIVEGLGEERNGALCHRYFSYLVVGMSRYKDDRDRMFQLDEATLKLNTAESRHFDVEDQTVGVAHAFRLQERFGGFEHLGPVTG